VQEQRIDLVLHDLVKQVADRSISQIDAGNILDAARGKILAEAKTNRARRVELLDTVVAGDASEAEMAEFLGADVTFQLTELWIKVEVSEANKVKAVINVYRNPCAARRDPQSGEKTMVGFGDRHRQLPLILVLNGDDFIEHVRVPNPRNDRLFVTLLQDNEDDWAAKNGVEPRDIQELLGQLRPRGDDEREYHGHVFTRSNRVKTAPGVTVTQVADFVDTYCRWSGGTGAGNVEDFGDWFEVYGMISGLVTCSTMEPVNKDFPWPDPLENGERAPEVSLLQLSRDLGDVEALAYAWNHNVGEDDFEGFARELSKLIAPDEVLYLKTFDTECGCYFKTYGYLIGQRLPGNFLRIDMDDYAQQMVKTLTDSVSWGKDLPPMKPLTVPGP